MPDVSLATKAPDWKRSDWVAGLLVILLASVPFLQAGHFSFVNYDDPLHISGQPMVLSGLNAESLAWSLSATPTNLWHPLTWISYMMEVSLLGGGVDSPEVHHLGNLALHLGATLFFFLLLRSLNVSILVSALAALAFSMHPLHVEPVAWISSRKDMLYGFFALASLFFYSQSRHTGTKTKRWFWLTLTMTAAAMTSKPSAVVLPCLFLLIDYHAYKANDSGKAFNTRNAFLSKWPYLALAAFVAITTVIVQYGGSHREIIGQQDTLSRLAALPASLGFYIQHLLWPLGLSFDYANPQGQHFIILTITGVSLFLGLSSLAWQWRHRFPSLIVGWVWFLICLAPVLGFLYVGPSFTADRYAYLALAGPTLALASLVDAQAGKRKVVISSLLCLLVIALGAGSYRQAGIWKNNESLFAYGVSVQPRSDLAQTNWARVCSLQGNDELALHHYHKALKLDASRHYMIHHHIALIQYRRGEPDQAINSCRLSLAGYNDYAPAHHLLGQLLEEKGGNTNQALQHLIRAHEIGAREHDPAIAKYAYSCALAYAKREQYTQAAKVLQSAPEKGNMSNAEQKQIETLHEMLKPYLSR